LRVLVTGASGFVGRWAVTGLLRRGAEVFAMSRRPLVTPGANAAAGDLLDAAATRRIVTATRPDTILHCAWMVEPGKFWGAAENLDWVAASMHLARAAAEAGAARFVGVGTCFEYAWPDAGVCDELTTAVTPTNLYAIAKDAVRRALAGWAVQSQLSFAWARLFHLYGPFEHPSRLVSSIAINVARGEPAPISSGRAVRDYMDVRDAGDALAALAVSRVENAVNIASGRPATVAEIADLIGRTAGRTDLIARGSLPDRPDEPPRILAATQRLVTEVAAPPPRPLEQGLAEAYAWWQSRAENVA
jgi:nucleoside-diphosphate-sugar epimerase